MSALDHQKGKRGRRGEKGSRKEGRKERKTRKEGMKEESKKVWIYFFALVTGRMLKPKEINLFTHF